MDRDRNQMSDIGPLVANTGLGAQDTVLLSSNRLDLSKSSQASQDIQTLRGRGVRVTCHKVKKSSSTKARIRHSESP